LSNNLFKDKIIQVQVNKQFQVLIFPELFFIARRLTAMLL